MNEESSILMSIETIILLKGSLNCLHQLTFIGKVNFGFKIYSKFIKESHEKFDT